jgi:hypothetical protein
MVKVMSSIDVSLEVLKIVIINETFDGLDINNKTEKILELFTKIHRRIQEIDTSSVEKEKSSYDAADTGENGDNRDKLTADTAEAASTGENGDKRGDK